MAGPLPMIVVPPGHFCVVHNPVRYVINNLCLRVDKRQIQRYACTLTMWQEQYQWLPMIIVSIGSIMLWRTWFLTLEYWNYSSEHTQCRFADRWVLLAGQLPIIMVKLDHFCVVNNNNKAMINVLCDLGPTSLWTTIWRINDSFLSYKIPSHSCVGQPIIL